MQDKHIVITGPTAGIGRSAALTLASRGAVLTLLCRNRDKADQLAQEIEAAGGESPAIVIMDMAELDSVRRAGEQVIANGRPVDVLLNNAGVIHTQRRVTADGFEETLAVNHFAPFLLTGELMPALQQSPAARIVNVASDAHAFVRNMGFDDMQAQHNYRVFREYGRSKLANILFTRELAQRLKGSDVTVNCLHPGAVSTSLGTQNGGFMARVLPALLKPFFRSPDKGAETSVYLCADEDAGAYSGEYFVDCKVRQPKPWARDPKAARELWRYTEQTLDYTFPV
jgi:NAD(P)-dependent dehydrogenase (short-subunit alcohol dehydrogenase family)